MVHSKSDGFYTTWYLGWGGKGRQRASEVRAELIRRGFELTGDTITVDGGTNTRALYCGKLDRAWVFHSKLIVVHNGDPNNEVPASRLYRTAKEVLG